VGITLNTTARELTRSGLFGKDYDTYVNELVDFLHLRFGDEIASNIVASSQGLAQIEMVAFALSTASWYGDRQADDTNLRDCRLRAAGTTIARQLGYKPTAATPPAVEITMTLETAPIARLTLEKGRKLTGPAGLIFETTAELIFDVGEVGPKTFSARQGETLEETFTSDGEPDQVFKITTIPSGKSISQDSPQVFVAATEWTEQEFLTYEQTNQFEFQYDFDPPQLVFGNGVAGNIPPKDTEVRIKFFVTDGTAGSVPANTVVTFVQPLVAGGQILNPTLTHNSPSTPGSDRENLASIKVNAPQRWQAAQRSVTLTDLTGWINSFVDPTFGGVAIGRANNPRAVDQDAEALTIIALLEAEGTSQDIIDRVETYWNSVLAAEDQPNVILAQILAADEDGRYVTPSSGLARSLESFLNQKTVSSTVVHVVDGSINLLSVDIAVEIRVTVDIASQEQREAVETDVRSTVEDMLLGRSYGESLRISDLYAAVDAVSGVDWANIEITNQPTRLNRFGDLVIEPTEVITLGALPTVTTVLA
jgi:hypothetical protein